MALAESFRLIIPVTARLGKSAERGLGRTIHQYEATFTWDERVLVGARRSPDQPQQPRQRHPPEGRSCTARKYSNLSDGGCTSGSFTTELLQPSLLRGLPRQPLTMPVSRADAVVLQRVTTWVVTQSVAVLKKLTD